MNLSSRSIGRTVLFSAKQELSPAHRSGAENHTYPDGINRP